MINPDDIKEGLVLGLNDALILRQAVRRLNSLEIELLALRKPREGWKLVPVDPTNEMMWAAKQTLSSVVGWDSFKEAYFSFLAAAPEPPAC